VVVSTEVKFFSPHDGETVAFLVNACCVYGAVAEKKNMSLSASQFET
jgi:hypothetical protein